MISLFHIIIITVHIFCSAGVTVPFNISTDIRPFADSVVGKLCVGYALSKILDLQCFFISRVGKKSFNLEVYNNLFTG